MLGGQVVVASNVFQALTSIHAPPQHREELIGCMRRLVEPTEAEPGCLCCCCYRSEIDPDDLLFLELWRSREDFEHHVRSERFRVLLSIVDLSAREPTMRFDEIGTSGGMEYLSRVLARSAPGQRCER